MIFSKKLFNFLIELIFFDRNNSWIAGEHEGVVMTDGDQITKDMKVVNPQNGTIDMHCHTRPHSPGSTSLTDQPKPHQGFLSLTVTVALCKNVHSKWNQLIRKHLNEDR